MPRERIGDVELYYEVFGDGEETIAFVNGIAMTVESWTPVREYFQPRYRCVLHDMRGQLMSEKPEMDYTMELHAEDMKNLFDHLGVRRVHLVGTSYGSEVAMIFALSYPEMVETLHVVTGVSELDGLMRAVTETWAVGARHGMESFFAAMMPWVYSSKYIENNRSQLEERQKALSALPGSFLEGFIRLVKAFQRLDITDRLHGIECPTLVVSAEHDIVKPPRFAELIHRNIEGSELVVMPGSGHALVVEDPIGLSDVIRDFIERHS